MTDLHNYDKSTFHLRNMDRTVESLAVQVQYIHFYCLLVYISRKKKFQYYRVQQRRVK